LKNIYIVLEDFNASGGVRILTEVGNIAADAGACVTFVHPDYGAMPYYKVSKNAIHKKVKTRLVFRRLQYFFRIFLLGWSSESIVITSSYRLIHMFDHRRTKLILLIQGVDRLSLIELSDTPIVGRWVNYFLLRRSELKTCMRIYVSEYLQRNSSQTGQVINNFVAPIFFASQNHINQKGDDKITIGFVGNSSRNKGYDLFLKLQNSLNNSQIAQRIRVDFVCATNDVRIIESNISKAIQVICPKSDLEMVDFYRSCDIVLSLSVSEGFGLPALEAMAMNCAVIATKSGGVEDFIVHRNNGFLLESRNEDDLLSAVIELIKDVDFREAISSRASVSARKYSQSQFKSDYLSLLSSLGAL